MMIRQFPFGACLLLSLPVDVIAVIARFVSPRDICNLTLCCKSLCNLVDSERIWVVQCELVKVLPLLEIVKWRIGISSYKALCRFLVEVVKPLVGVWAQKYPELGNVVYVMPGFLSVVGCRIIPQEVGPLGIQDGQVKWSPVFEIICGGVDGSTGFLLHGSVNKRSFLYPGLVLGIEKTCDVLLLEVEPRREKKLCSEIEKEAGKNEGGVPFCNLECPERRNLLGVVACHVGLRVDEPLRGKLFPTRLQDDEEMMLERRAILLKMLKFGGSWKHMKLEEDEPLCYNPRQVDINEMWANIGYDIGYYMDSREVQMEVTPTKRHSSSDLQSFLSSGDTFGLSLKATHTEVASKKEWPIMREYCFSLYKLPIKKPSDNQEYAGLWGGTFGWPLGNCPEDKPGKTLFLLMLTYEESQNESERYLVGRKILEGSDYAMHPNGSVMFVVDINTPSLEPFPFDADGNKFECSYSGRGITKGYGFRYPGYKPGTLFVTSKGLLIFVWQETKVVFTLQRLNLEEALKKGLGTCVPPLRPTENFTYMSLSHANVFVKTSKYSFYSE